MAKVFKLIHMPSLAFTPFSSEDSARWWLINSYCFNCLGDRLIITPNDYLGYKRLVGHRHEFMIEEIGDEDVFSNNSHSIS